MHSNRLELITHNMSPSMISLLSTPLAAPPSPMKKSLSNVDDELAEFACGITPCNWGPKELSELFVRYRKHLSEMIRVRLDARLQARVDASDIVQDLYLRATQNLETYTKTHPVPPLVWLRTLGKHLVAETHRKHFRKKRSPELENQNLPDDVQFLSEFLADSIESLGSKLAKAEILAKVKELLKEIPANDREIIELRHVDGFTFQEAADALGMPLDTVKKRYYRALDRFKDLANVNLA